MLTALITLLGTQVALATSPMIPDAEGLARRESLRRALMTRDQAPACTQLLQMSDALISDLQWLMDHVKAPPWVGVRAAQCILQLQGDKEVQRVIGWVQDPAKAGLALLVLGELDMLTEESALQIAQAAMKGPHAARVTPHIHKSVHPQVRALESVAEPTP